ncbi:MAG: response regulator transcription factor [Lachnospiraceae bacterium]|nr:response regulator transcription factor [Lachnospiraceae bacterium]
MIINIAVCDDEQESLERILKELYRVASKLKITIETFPYSDENKVVDLIYNNKEDFDILFLDIDMPNISGLEVAKKLREKKSDIILIFISSYEQYVFESIEYNPFRYIRKNRIGKELFLAVKAAHLRLEEMKDTYIVVKTEDSEARIKHSDIMYFETVERKIGIHLSNGEMLAVRKTIKELCEELNDENFIRIHSGCVANAKYIDKFSSYDITLDNGEHLIVSRTRVKNVKTALMNFWGDRL